MNWEKDFFHPPKEYSAVVLWFWNGELNPDFLGWQIDEMVDKGVYGAFMHARAYLKTPYLGEDWWKAVDRCIEKGRETGFSPWLYDEYAWPSGTAGSVFEYGYQSPSRILAQGEANMAKGLVVKRFKPDEAVPEKNLVINCPGQNGEQICFYREIYPRNVDYLNKDTIAFFIKSTHEEYKKRYGNEFGKLIPGIFFDEIFNIGNPLPWTDSFPEEFSRRCGYDILPNLPLLIENGNNAEQIRHDYYHVLSELYEAAFFIQISEWCQKNKLILTGHTEEEFPFHPRRQGHYFDTMRHLDVPGADNHDYRYKLPRKITFCEPKYAVSVARAYGKKRGMSEAMGGAGWGCSLQEYKRGINVLGAMGINFFTLHGFYNECEHQGSQADWPASFFYQNPYWKYFKTFGDYISRVSFINSRGNPVVDLGLFYPIEELYLKTKNGNPDQQGIELAKGFDDALKLLLNKQMDTDFIDRESLEKSEICQGKLCIGSQRFKALVFPSEFNPGVDLRKKLKTFAQQGGYLFFYSCGKNNHFPQGFEESDNIIHCCLSMLPETISKTFQPDVYIRRGDGEEIYTNHRKIDDYDVYMVSNGSDAPREIEILFRSRGAASILKPENGNMYPADSQITRDGTSVSLNLNQDEAVFVLIGNNLPGNLKENPKFRLHNYLTLSGKWTFLPLPEEYKYQKSRPLQEEIWLEIPTARFSGSINHQSSSMIRIQNRKDQKGFCGRHLSPWNANWITRRPGWSDDVGATDLYFRKTITINESIILARFTLKSVGKYSLYINGTLSESGDGKTRDFFPVLKQGENLIAVHLHNTNPMSEVNFAESETLPEERLTSLILEGEIECEKTSYTILSDSSWFVCRQTEDNWFSPEYSLKGKTGRYDPQSSRRQADIPAPEKWLPAWERGKPPLQPWGDFPLQGKGVSFPQDIYYEIELPRGTTEIAHPDVSGKFEAFLNGRPVSFSQGNINIPPDSVDRLLLKVEASNLKDGLKSNLKVKVIKSEILPGDWRRQGLSWFSGYGLYNYHLNLDKRKGYKYYLDLGDVRFYTEVYINREKAGICLWNPYRLEITDSLTSGENLIEVVVANSAAVERRFMLVDEGEALAWNRYWNEDNIDREPRNLVSGLQGPVRLYFEKPDKS